EHVCRDMQWAGIELDSGRNQTAAGEMCISTDNSRIQVWTVPTNEELVVARQTAELIQHRSTDH
ncbi:MAG: acetate/propionate family kinase, partial [Planctomycetaceae bacterium]